jgi:hypothetical protein
MRNNNMRNNNMRNNNMRNNNMRNNNMRNNNTKRDMKSKHDNTLTNKKDDKNDVVNKKTALTHRVQEPFAIIISCSAILLQHNRTFVHAFE